MLDMKRYIIITKRDFMTAVAAVLAVVAISMLAARLDNVAVPVSNWNKGVKLPIYGVESADKRIALTFNAAWTAEDIPELLEMLNQHQVMCTFFLVGEWAEKNPSQARMIAQAGHEIGNHSYAHPDMTKLTAQQIKDDISKADAAIQQATGVWPVLFRAPSGAYNDTAIEAAQSLSHVAVQWTVDSIDWKRHDAAALTKRVLQKARPGAIVLMHTGLENTRAALPDIIAGLKAEGYTFVVVGEMLIKDDYTIDHNGIQHPAASKPM